MFAVILALAGLVTFLVVAEIDKNKNAYNSAVSQLNNKPKGMVLVLTKDVPEGGTITAECLETKQVELNRISDDMLTDPSQAVGRIAKFSLPTASYLSAHDLTIDHRPLGFQAKLREGERAITFAVDSTTGVAGFVTPDSNVDIIAQVGSGSEVKSAPILSDVRVVAVGTIYQKNPGDTNAQPVSSVTVAVRPDDADKLINAMSAGRIYLTLRSDKDHTPVTVWNINSLFNKPHPPAAVGVIPPPPLPPPLAVLPENNAASFAPVAKPPSFHEVEQWSGGNKNIAQVNQN
jgi:pilus assembly protein CpaB